MKLKRNDVVVENTGIGFTWYGRVWYRIDNEHVVVIDCGKYITVYKDDELKKVDYKGYWDGYIPDKSDEFLTNLVRFRHPVFRKMPSLRRLKQRASYYNPGIFKKKHGPLDILQYTPRYKETTE